MAGRWAQVALTTLGGLTVAATPLDAQSFHDAERALAQGDTNRAIAVYETMVSRDYRNAEAHYRAGMLYMTRHVPGSNLSPNRRRAEEHFRYATRLAGDSAKYWLALADVFRGEDVSFTRMQVAGLLTRANEAAMRHGAAEVAARVAYRTARVHWERYEHWGRRYFYNRFDVAGIDEGRFFGDWRYVEQFFEESVRPDPETSGDENLREAETNLRRMLGADPASIDAAGLLVVLMAEHHRWPEALAVTRRLVEVVPDSGRAWALYGLALVREQRWSEADTAYRLALARMAPQDARPYLDLGLIMRAADRIRYEQLADAGRARLDTVYWATAQPLALTDVNELQTEFYARLTYVLHRWSDPLRGYDGHESDIGAVYVRYGPPDIWAVFDRSVVAWVYLRPRLRFRFELMPGFARAHHSEASTEALRQNSQQSPARFDNVPVFRSLDTIAVQTAQFRGDHAHTTTVAVVGAIPLAALADSAAVADVALITAAILTDEQGREVGRNKRDEVVRDPREAAPTEPHTWTLDLPARSYLLRVEAHLPVLERGARSAAPLEVRSYADRDRLMLSDVLVAERAAPRDSAARRWDDLSLEPSAGRYAPGAPLALVWEIYNLTPDSSGSARYTIALEVTVASIERRTVFARVLGGIGDAVGLSALGDNKVSLDYDRAVAASPDGVQLEYLTLELRDAPIGRYTITVTVTDDVSGQTAMRARTVVVTDEPLVRDADGPRGPRFSR